MKKKGATATNLKRTDIQKVSTYDYTKYKHQPDQYDEYTSTEETSSELIHFGETKTYTTNNKYPDMWNENDKNWTYKYEGGTVTGGDKECKTWGVIGTGEGQMDDDMNNGDTTTTFKQSHYRHDYKRNEFINDKYYDLIFRKTNGSLIGACWLSDRFVHLFEDYCYFGLQVVTGNSVRFMQDGVRTCNSDGGVRCSGRLIRPIVSIDLERSGCKITEQVGTDGKVGYKLEWNKT